MEENFSDVLDSIQQSVIRIELLAFLQANPYTRDTAAGFSLRLHRPCHQLEPALQSLSALGILEIGGTSKVTIYRLRSADLIRKFFKEHCGEDKS